MQHWDNSTFQVLFRIMILIGGAAVQRLRTFSLYNEHEQSWRLFGSSLHSRKYRDVSPVL